MTFNTKGLMSSIKQDWTTPKQLYEELDKEFCFDFDPCPTDYKVNGLEIEWKQSNFVNPPYKDLALWIKKSWEEWKKGKTIVMLIPARTDTKAFHKYIYKQAEIRFIKGRLRFGNAKGSAPFPSMVIIYRK